tara:strand:- start:184 stop:351 length:168 start_codon:yes stop_codon:yes gene_type:complete
MNAFKIWIAQHPVEVGNLEVSLKEPTSDITDIYSERVDDSVWVKWVEHICIPIQE